MTLSSMVVSRDWQEISVLECILGGLHMDVTVEVDPLAAVHRLSHSKIDALIVDCDLEGSLQLVRHLHTPGRPFNTVPLVITGKRQHMASLDHHGAVFAFEKPISVEQAVRTLSAARCMILEGRLRYHRIGVEIPVSLEHRGHIVSGAHLVNLSQGGMRIYTDGGIDTGAWQISCELPGAQSQLQAQAEVVWQDKRGNVGVRFVKVSAQHQKALELWVARQFLTN